MSLNEPTNMPISSLLGTGNFMSRLPAATSLVPEANTLKGLAILLEIKNETRFDNNNDAREISVSVKIRLNRKGSRANCI